MSKVTVVHRAKRILRAQRGPQEDFLRTSADIAFYGGAAGGGKSFGLLLEGSRHIKVDNFSSVFFRRTRPEHTNPGGLWDESHNIYRGLGGRPKSSPHLMWNFTKKGIRSKIQFASMQHENDRFAWKGAQIPLIGWDELTGFTYKQFIYMLSRNRSTCGIKPYQRGTTNPDPDSWVREFIDWYIGSDGFPIASRKGKLRYFARKGQDIIWANNASTLIRKGLKPKSFTFIPATLADNQELVKRDPDYQANLEALPRHERLKLLEGNWDARAVAGDYFKREWFNILDTAPAGQTVRFWDRAATIPSEDNSDPDWTRGVKIIRTYDHKIPYVVADVVSVRDRPGEVERVIRNTAAQDGKDVYQILEQEPGASGIAETDHLMKILAGYPVDIVRHTTNKEVRARPFSSQVQHGNVALLRGKWNKEYLSELEAYVGKATEGHDDQVDGSSGAFNWLADSETTDSIDVWEL